MGGGGELDLVVCLGATVGRLRVVPCLKDLLIRHGTVVRVDSLGHRRAARGRPRVGRHTANRFSSNCLITPVRSKRRKRFRTELGVRRTNLRAILVHLHPFNTNDR